MARRRLLPLVALLAVAAVAACGDDDAAPSVAITDAWARTTPPGATVGAIYFVADATTDDAIVAVSVEPAIAGAVELHHMSAIGDDTDDHADLDDHADHADHGDAPDNDMMSMEQVDRLELPAGDDVDIATDGYHVMLVDLAAPLEAGDVFDLTLGFEHAPEQTVTIEVRDQAPGDG